jgi:outer membrane receptor protein involved in Fe transport
VSVYGFGGITRREGEAAGFFRRAQDDRTVRAIHPDGFLPMIGTEIWDGSGPAGARGSLLGWGWDLSAVYGRNTFRFDIGNSNNVTLGTASPTDFYAGTLGFSQLTGNLDLVRQFAVGLATPLNVAAGAEYRLDRYSIEAGEPDSYRDGGVRILDGPNRGAQAQLGAQVFPGFRPTDEVDADRDNVAAYLDLEANLLPSLLVTVAGRAERYSDFGSTSDGRVAARFEPLRGFAVRGSAGTGFRAPSLAQSYFSATATNFVVVNGVNTPFEVRTLPVSSREAQVLGARKLQPEESVNLSLGVTLNPVPGLSATVDFYRIDIDDRIVLSGNFLGAPIRALFEQGGAARGGRRALLHQRHRHPHRRRGRGAQLRVRVGGEGRLRLTAGYNHNETEVLAVASTPPQLTGFQETLFDRVERGPHRERPAARQPGAHGQLLAGRIQRQPAQPALRRGDPVRAPGGRRARPDLRRQVDHRRGALLPAARPAGAAPWAPTTCSTSTRTSGRTSSSGGRSATTASSATAASRRSASTVRSTTRGSRWTCRNGFRTAGFGRAPAGAGSGCGSVEQQTTLLNGVEPRQTAAGSRPFGPASLTQLRSKMAVSACAADHPAARISGPSFSTAVNRPGLPM